jgi:hypothetical protein
MRVTTEFIELSSLDEWYWLEEEGRKPNTVRLLDEGELRRVMTIHPGWIHIINASDESLSFARRLTGIHLLDSLLGKHLVMFCWVAR